MTYEVVGADNAQRKQLKAFGETERIDHETVNVLVEDESVDDLAEWLEAEGLKHRAV
jgi:hypothetical protein